MFLIKSMNGYAAAFLVAAVLALAAVATVMAGEAERTAALQGLGTSEVTAYVGNTGTVGMDGATADERATHPSILFRLLGAKKKNDNSLIGSVDELLADLAGLAVSIDNLKDADDDFNLINSESDATTGFTFLERLEVLKQKMEEVATLVPDSGINNDAQKQAVIAKVDEIITSLATAIELVESKLIPPLPAGQVGIDVEIFVDGVKQFFTPSQLGSNGEALATQDASGRVSLSVEVCPPFDFSCMNLAAVFAIREVAFPAGTAINFKILNIVAIPDDLVRARCSLLRPEVGKTIPGSNTAIPPAGVGDNVVTLVDDEPGGITLHCEVLSEGFF